MKLSRVPLLHALLTAAALGASACGGDTPGSGAGDAGADAGSPADARPRPSDAGEEPARRPTVNGVSPRSGSEAGGARVVVRGSAFAEPCEVFFGGAPATSVVVLDEVSIAATVPAGPVGPVTVRVVTPGGEAELPGGFVYHRDLQVLSVEPARLPDEGGVRVTVRGRGFDADTLVFLDREPLRGARLVDAERIEGFAPALAPGRPELRVLHRDAEVRRSDLVLVYGTPDPRSVAPGYGPVGGAAGQEVDGDGLAGVSSVLVGGAPGGEVQAFTPSRVGFRAPPRAEGPHDVVVANGDAQGVLPGGYVAFDPSRPGLAVLGVTPRRASAAGGDVVTVVGRGFAPGAQVVVGGRRALLRGLEPSAARIVVPAGLPVGLQRVRVVSAGAEAEAEGLLELVPGVTVEAVSPARGPVAGGFEVTVTGSGFTADARVRIADIPLEDVVVVSDRELRGRVVAGAAGPRRVEVATAHGRAVLEAGFEFEEPFEVIRIEPEEGSVAGNTHVTVFGRGFAGPVEVRFGGVEGRDATLEPGGLIGVRTAPSGAGAVDVEVRSASASVTLPGAFRFYDPTLLTGGAWGGPVVGSVNVSVMSFDGAPIPGMVVQLGLDADPRYAAVTDDAGLATVSAPELRGAQTVTVGGPDQEFVTFLELDARNLTVFSGRHPSAAPPEPPFSPCPSGAQPPVVRGRIFKFKSALDPSTRPGWVPVARITYSDGSVFAPNPPEPAEQVDFVFSEGEEFEIVVMRAGTVAVYATLGDLDTATNQFIPRRMGIARSVPVAPETVTEGIDIALDIELGQSTEIRLDAPPEQVPGPSINAVFPFLNLASDGVIPFEAALVAGTSSVFVDNLPALAESSFFYMGGSFTFSPAGGLRNPFSISFVESADPLELGVDLGPFLQMPQDVAPKAGTLLRDGISWAQAGVVPDLVTINVVDVRAVSGCCCLDLNVNGTCDRGEQNRCGSLPQQFNRWSVFSRGGLASYPLPRMPAGVTAFEAPTAYSWLGQAAIAPRFSYDEFIYNQFSPYFWRSWAVFSSQFLVKERTD